MPWSLGRQVPQARCGGRFATTRGHCCYHSESCCEKTQWVSGLQSPLPMPWCLKELVAKAGSLPAIPASEHGSPGRPEGTLLLESLTLKHGIQYRREGRVLDPQEDGRSILMIMTLTGHSTWWFLRHLNIYNSRYDGDPRARFSMRHNKPDALGSWYV